MEEGKKFSVHSHSGGRKSLKPYFFFFIVVFLSGPHVMITIHQNAQWLLPCAKLCFLYARHTKWKWWNDLQTGADVLKYRNVCSWISLDVKLHVNVSWSVSVSFQCYRGVPV